MINIYFITNVGILKKMEYVANKIDFCFGYFLTFFLL